MNSNDDALSDGRLDLVPMIDCIMLLLLFFLMTTKFTPEEQRLGALLTAGGSGPITKVIQPPPVIAIALTPADAPEGASERDLTRLAENPHPDALLRIGGREPLRISGKSLDDGSAMAVIHAHIASALADYEATGKARADQSEVQIHCFSGLSWKFALTAYDAVRSYEATKGGVLDRTVSFASPRLRDASPNIRGQEWFEILHVRPGT